MVAAVVLAAGAGRRMGNRPKALLPVDGETYLERVVRTVREAGLGEIWVVIRPGIPDLAELASALDVNTIENPDPDRGMFSSVQCGASAALTSIPGPEGILLHPVDHPYVRSETVALVLGQLRIAGDHAWVVPTHAGRGGHPVGLGRRAAQEVTTLPSTAVLREALGNLSLDRVDLEVDDPAVLVNRNLPPAG